MVIVPNSVISKSLVVNHSYPDTQYRIQIEIGVAYGTDLEFARKTIIDTVRDVEGVLPDRKVEALFLRFGDSAHIFRVRWWLESYVDTRRMFDRVNTALYNALNEAGIEMPFPSQEVYHKIAKDDLPQFLEIFRGKK
jgi:small-conductance mechanosensitive channel